MNINTSEMNKALCEQDLEKTREKQRLFLSISAVCLSVKDSGRFCRLDKRAVSAFHLKFPCFDFKILRIQARAPFELIRVGKAY